MFGEEQRYLKKWLPTWAADKALSANFEQGLKFSETGDLKCLSSHIG